MSVHNPIEAPRPFAEVRQNVAPSRLPLVAVKHGFHWSAHHLTNWYSALASMSMIIAVIFYFSETNSRIMQRHYQAWQVINTAQGKGGSGGRIEALEQLHHDKVPLVGVDVSGAFLQGLKLEHAKLVRSNFHNADVRNGSFVQADLSDADLSGANFRNANFHAANLSGADLNDADLDRASLEGADLSGANLEGANLRNADLLNVKWSGIQSVKNADLRGARNAPPEFFAWAEQNGALKSESAKQAGK